MTVRAKKDNGSKDRSERRLFRWLVDLVVYIGKKKAYAKNECYI